MNQYDESHKREKSKPRKEGTTITLILPSTTNLNMSLPIRLNSIFLRTFITFPLLFTMFSTKMLLNSSQISQSSRRIMMNTARFRTNINPLPNLFARSLPQLPWQVMASSMKLKILISLKSFVAYFAYESVCRH